MNEQRIIEWGRRHKRAALLIVLLTHPIQLVRGVLGRS